MVLVNNTLVQIKPLDRSSSGKVFICYLFIEEPRRSFQIHRLISGVNYIMLWTEHPQSCERTIQQKTEKKARPQSNTLMVIKTGKHGR